MVSHEKSSNIYVFGGCLDKDFNNVIEKYDTVMNVWVTLTLSISVEFDKIRHFVTLQPSIIFGGKEKKENEVKYKPGVPTGEKFLFFKENRYTDCLEVVSFSLKDGAVNTIYSCPALVKGNVSGVIQQYEKEESVMLVFREFNE